MTHWFPFRWTPRRRPQARTTPPRAAGTDSKWWRVLGFEDGPPPSLSRVEARYRRLAAAAHPDRGGSTDWMQELNRARFEARAQLRR